ncbi:MAG TPA: DUF3810 domain-containing protein [Clostridiaceae bacterium]
MLDRRKKLYIIVLGLFIFIINIILRYYPGFVDKYYSRGINKIAREALTSVTNMIPFSLGEVLVLILVALLLILIIKFVIHIRKKCVNGLLNLGVYLSIIYILFMVLWGFNYDRLTLDKILNLQLRKYDEKELYKLCDSLASRANELRKLVDEDKNGVMTIKGGYKSIRDRASLGYIAAAKKYPFLGGINVYPKPVLLSEALSYGGITGIYIPFTGEANINIKDADFMLPSTCEHEIAHEKGFAREEEANYIAYITSMASEDVNFQYSGTMMALIYSSNALYDANKVDYRALIKNYSLGVKKDLQFESKLWSKYNGKVQKLQERINNAYLKSNGEEKGIQSYDSMVEYLISNYYKK